MLLVLDEPNANLDAEGSVALNIAIRNAKKDGRSVVIMAHRPAAIEECDLILILEGGNRVAFGPRDEVLKQHLTQLPADAPAHRARKGAHLDPAARRNTSGPTGRRDRRHRPAPRAVEPPPKAVAPPPKAIASPPKALPGLLGTGLLTGGHQYATHGSAGPSTADGSPEGGDPAQPAMRAAPER